MPANKSKPKFPEYAATLREITPGQFTVVGFTSITSAKAPYLKKGHVLVRRPLIWCDGFPDPDEEAPRLVVGLATARQTRL